MTTKVISTLEKFLTTNGICNSEDNSSKSLVVVWGWTMPPWFDRAQYDPTNCCEATVCLNTSTFNVSARISSVSYWQNG